MSNYSIYHCEGVGCGVADGVAGYDIKPLGGMKLPRSSPSPLTSGLLEQAQTRTASEKIAIAEMRAQALRHIDRLPCSGVRELGA